MPNGRDLANGEKLDSGSVTKRSLGASCAEPPDLAPLAERLLPSDRPFQ